MIEEGIEHALQEKYFNLHISPVEKFEIFNI